MHGPEYPNDEEALRRAIARDNELEPTVRELERKASEVELRASALERERDEAKESASAIGQRYEKLQQTYRKEREAHASTKIVGLPAGPACRPLAGHLCCFVAAADVGVGACYAKARSDRENAGFRLRRPYYQMLVRQLAQEQDSRGRGAADDLYQPYQGAIVGAISVVYQFQLASRQSGPPPSKSARP